MKSIMLKVLTFLLFILPFAFSTCPNGTLEYQSNCYYFNVSETGFAAAEISCGKIGGNLVSIHDSFINVLLGYGIFALQNNFLIFVFIFVLFYVKKFGLENEEAQNYFYGSTVSDFWIGANNLISNGKWNWTDGTNFDFNDWNKGEPMNTSSNNCAALSLTGGYWSAQDCFKSKPFVCKVSATPNYPIYQNCSKGWFYFAPTHSCYGINVGGFYANWTASENNCEKLGAFLPSINSLPELELLTSYVYTHWWGFWTDIFSVNGGKTWKASDGSYANFLTYGNWCRGNPTTAGGERCISLGSNGDGGCFLGTDCSVQTEYTLCKKTLA